MSAAAPLASNAELAALQLAEEYGVPVFPCRPDKRPYTAHGFQDASTNLEAIEDWWRQWPDALIGVPTGRASRIVVVDVDPDGAAWYREHADRLGCGRVHRTRRGHHLLYRAPEAVEIRNSASQIARGIDVRGAGGYIIWWPAHGFAALGNLADITEPPPWLLELLVRPAAAAQAVPESSAVGSGKIGAGRRNEFLSREAYRLRKQGATVEQIGDVLEALNSSRCSPPLSDNEVVQIARGKERVQPEHHTDGEEPTWQAPSFATYGAGFDPAQIPLRRWLLGNRRSVGEVTIDAGPPGVNKSTLMLTDAVAIATGRKILADTVHETGGVLYLAGEDARRDVEARLAGILQFYEIEPAELADRLRVVYLAEVDALAYTLAQMAEDMAALNLQMLGWLRELPDTIAVFVDPLMAWHRLLENSNEAVQLLSTSMRAIAVQGNRHVGIDHHVTKVTMADPEGHVGNLASVRGAGSLIGYTRWAFSMARLNGETAGAHGIPDPERSRYRRLDPLKTSYGSDAEQMRLLRVESVTIANGENVPVLVEQDLEIVQAEAKERKTAIAEAGKRHLGEALVRMLNDGQPRSANAAALWLLTHAPELVTGKRGEPLSEFTVRRKIPTMIGAGLWVTLDGKRTRIVMRATPGRGNGSEITFAQPAGEP